MTKVTNTGRTHHGTQIGPRVVNVWHGDQAGTEPINPGETKDVELHDVDHPAFVGMVKAGDLKADLDEARQVAKDRKARKEKEAAEAEAKRATAVVEAVQAQQSGKKP